MTSCKYLQYRIGPSITKPCYINDLCYTLEQFLPDGVVQGKWAPFSLVLSDSADMTENSENIPSTAAPTGILSKVVRIVLPVLVLGIGIAGYWNLSEEPEEEKSPPAKKQAIRTKITTLHTQDYQIVIAANGIVQPHNEISLSAQVSGTITKISPALEAGSFFSEGEVLIAIDDRDYKTALAIAEAQHLSAKSALQLATLNYERMLEGYREPSVAVVTKAEVDQAFSVRAQAEAELESSEAQIDRAKLDLDRTTIRAPFDGRVRQKDVGLGQTVGPGTPLGVIFAVDYAEVRLPIAGRDLRHLTLPELDTDPPLDVELRDAISEDSETIWQAHIVRTDGVLDENSLELYAIARIDDPYGQQNQDKPPLKIGQFVDATITGQMLTDVFVLPRDAVYQGNQVIVFAEGLLKRKTVDVVWGSNDAFIVDGGLSAGEQLVTTPLGNIVSGTRAKLANAVQEQD